MLPAVVAFGAMFGGKHLLAAPHVPLGIHILTHPQITEQLAHFVLGKLRHRLDHPGRVIPHVHRDLGEVEVVQSVLQGQLAHVAFHAALGLEYGLPAIASGKREPRIHTPRLRQVAQVG